MTLTTRCAAIVLATGLSLAGCQTRRASTPPEPLATVPAPVQPAPARLLTAGTRSIPVVMYHDIVPKKDVWFDLTVREFEGQMAALKQAGATVVPLADVVDHLRDGKPLPPRSIALTFDDGTLGNYEHALPILRRYGYPATFFVHTAYVGIRSTSKDHMTWDQLREIQSEGLVDVQPHTVTHPPDLRELDDASLRRELEESKSVMEAELGHAVRFLAYPSGWADERVARAVKAAGYEAAWNEVRAWNASPADSYHLPRFAPFRLNLILDRWKRGDTPTYSTATWVTTNGPQESFKIRPSAGAEGVAPEVTALDIWAGQWPGLEGGALIMSAETPVRLPVHRVVLGPDYRGVPDGEQWSAIGRPFVVFNGNEAVFASYQPWMGAEPESLDVLLPGTTFAVLGRAWLVQAGRPVEELPGRIGRRTVLGLLEDGRPVVGRTHRTATRNGLLEALRQRNVQTAVLLD